jgi:hypothetical protein
MGATLSPSIDFSLLSYEIDFHTHPSQLSAGSLRDGLCAAQDF